MATVWNGRTASETFLRIRVSASMGSRQRMAAPADPIHLHGSSPHSDAPPRRGTDEIPQSPDEIGTLREALRLQQDQYAVQRVSQFTIADDQW